MGRQRTGWARLLGPATATFIVAVITSAQTAAQSPAPAAPPRSLDALLEPIRAEHQVPALSAALVQNGRITAIGAVGTRRADMPEPVTSDDVWHLGSCTKAMTATLIARLVERGTLSWSTTLPEAFPDLEASMDPAWHAVTLRLLLANRAGVSNDLSRNEVWAKMRRAEEDVVALRQLVVASIVSRPPAYEPGSQNLYSNTGFIIAGHAAEVATGRSWEDLMRAEVFGPLGMTGAGFGPPGHAAEAGGAPDQPRGHTSLGPVEPGPTADNPPSLGPAGTVHASLADWAKFVGAHVRGARAEPVLAVDGGPFLSPESFAILHTPIGSGPERGYALGWGVATRAWARGTGEGDHGRVLTHNGSNTLWYCVAWLGPERDMAILVTCNSAGSSAAAATDQAASAIIRDMK